MPITALTRPDEGTRTAPREARWATAILLVAAAACVRNLFVWHVERWDDAYITFRFARHLAGGAGLVWNVGGERVEGFSSLLHVVLLAATTAAGVTPETASLLIGSIAVAATATLLLHAVRRCTGEVHPLAALAIALYVTDAATAVHAASGLETQLFTALLACTYMASLAFAASPRLRTGFALAATSFVAVLARPEGALYVATTYVVLWVQAATDRTDEGARRRALAASTCALIVAGAVYAVWKLSYFGYLLPNPFYVKSGRLALAGALPVAAYIAHLAVRFGVPVALVVVLARHRIRGLLAQSVRTQHAMPMLLTLAPPIAALAYYVTILHEMGEFYRFCYPTLFYFAAAAALAMTICAEGGNTNGDVIRSAPVGDHSGTASPHSRAIGIAALLYLACAVAFDRPWPVAPRPAGEFGVYYRRIGDALRATDLGSRAVILCDAAGLIPYTSGFTHVDRVGLVDNRLSGRVPLTLAQREADIWNRRLDVYIGYEPPASPGAERAADDPLMRDPYATRLLGPWRGAVGERIFLNDRDLLHRRMRELRDRWMLIGELEWPGRQLYGLKSFAYVRRDSHYFEALSSHLKTIVVTGGRADGRLPRHEALERTKRTKCFSKVWSS